MLTAKEVGKRLNRTDRTIQRWCEMGILEGAKRTGPFKTSSWRIPETAVIAYEETYALL